MGVNYRFYIADDQKIHDHPVTNLYQAFQEKEAAAV